MRRRCSPAVVLPPPAVVRPRRTQVLRVADPERGARAGQEAATTTTIGAHHAVVVMVVMVVTVQGVGALGGGACVVDAYNALEAVKQEKCVRVLVGVIWPII